MPFAKRARILLAASMLCPSMAMAASDSFSGLLDGAYGYSRVPVGKSHLDSDQYTVHGALLYTLDNPGLNVQLEGSDDFYYAIKHNDAHLWNAGGSVFWRDAKGTFGFSTSYFSVDAPAAPLFSGKKSAQSYGLFGEYYAWSNLTLQIKGGGTTGPTGSASVFGGGGITFYESPDIAVHAETNFTSFASGHDWTDVRADIDYLPFNRVPLSLFAGYDYTSVSAGTNVSTFLAGLKYHFGAGRVLSTYDRTGPVQWTGNASPGANVKF